MDKSDTGLVDYSTRQSQKEGILMKDEEIFDFTGSRLVNPPTENRQNAPLIEPEVTKPALNGFQKSECHPMTQQPKLI